MNKKVKLGKETPVTCGYSVTRYGENGDDFICHRWFRKFSITYMPNNKDNTGTLRFKN